MGVLASGVTAERVRGGKKGPSTKGKDGGQESKIMKKSREARHCLKRKKRCRGNRRVAIVGSVH